MKKIDIMDCIEESENIIYDLDSKYEPIMNVPTLNHIGLYNAMKGPWDSYLGVLGSFVPSLDAILKGSKNIVAFDKNPLNILHCYLVIAGILALEYEDFLKFIFYSAEESFYSKFYFERLKDELPIEAKKYWGYIITEYENDPKLLSLFFNNIVLQKDSNLEIPLQLFANNQFYQREKFYQLKRKLKEVKLTILKEDFGSIPTILKNQQFDKIYLSCLNLYIYDNIDGYNYFDKLKEYLSLLKQNGVMEGAYLYYRCRNDYEMYTDEFSKKVPLEKVLIRTKNLSKEQDDLAYLYQKN